MYTVRPVLMLRVRPVLELRKGAKMARFLREFIKNIFSKAAGNNAAIG